MKKYRYMGKAQTRTQSLEDAISEALGELTTLAEECREVCDNMPDSLQATQRYEDLDNSASELEGLDEPDVPDDLKSLEVSYTLYVKKQMSRAARRDNACAILDECMQQLANIGNEDGENDDAEQLASDLEQIKDTAESCEFPGMRG